MASQAERKLVVESFGGLDRVAAAGMERGTILALRRMKRCTRPDHPAESLGTLAKPDTACATIFAPFQ